MDLTEYSIPITKCAFRQEYHSYTGNISHPTYSVTRTSDILCSMQHPSMKNPKIAIVARIARTSEQEFLTGLMQYIRTETNWEIHLLQHPEEFTTQMLDDLHADDFDGIITAESGMPGVAERLETSEIPLVVVGSRKNFLAKRKNNISFVTVNEEHIGRLSAEFFLSLGTFRTFVIIDRGSSDDTGPLEYVSRRHYGFTCELARHHLSCRCPNDAELADLIRDAPRPIAILTRNEHAIKILNICNRLRLKVPDHASILVLGNNSFSANCSSPSLSSIDLGSFDEGYEAGRQMTRLLSKRHTKPIHVLTKSAHRIHRRETTAPLKPAAHLIEKAIDYIHLHSKDPLTVQDVSRHLGVSRRLLDLRFHEYNDMSVSETIRNEKLKAVKRLLGTTRIPIDQVANECGFKCKTNLKTLFKKTFHMTMSDYRSSQQ